MEVYQVPIFQDISKDSVVRMVECFRMRQVRYKPEEVVCVYDGSGGEVGVVLEGTARLTGWGTGRFWSVCAKVGSSGSH